MRARSDFLSKGHYFPLVEAINSAILESHCGARSILDAGCGEGYYLDSLSKLRSSSPSACLTGIDISKEGVRRTAKRNPQITAAVASAYQLPFASSSVDIIMSVFSPICEEEFQRVLAPAGILIVVGPGSNHLLEIKTSLYDEVYPNQEDKAAVKSFLLERKFKVDYIFEVEDVATYSNLLMMTPYYWRTPKEKLAESVRAFRRHSVTASFVVSIFRNKKS